MATEPNGELRRNSQWQLIIGALMVVLVGLGVAGGIMSWVYGIAAKVDRHDGDLIEIRQQNTRSIDDRSSLTRDVSANKDTIAKLQTELASEVMSRTKDITEQETQIDATTQIFLGEVAGLHRSNAIAWPHIPDLGPYPVGPFTQPNVSNRRIK